MGHLQPSHTAGHFVRAIMQSTAASLEGLVDSLFPDGRPEKIVATGGGARSDLWLQMKADLLGVELVRTRCPEPACMGQPLRQAGSPTSNWLRRHGWKGTRHLDRKTESGKTSIEQVD